MKKKELTEGEAELTRTMEAVAKLQKRLQDVEKLLVSNLLVLLILHSME